MLTPCIRKCKVQDGMCVSCRRTLTEVKEESLLHNNSHDVRMKLMKELQSRTSTHACPECSSPAYCAMEDGKSSGLCWCMDVKKPYVPETSYESCLCKKCLTMED